MSEGVDAPDLKERLQAVRAGIRDACQRAGRDLGAVRLIAVSKRHPAEAIAAAHLLGVRDFGENYVQEMVDKLDALAGYGGLQMRFIGHLQRNKVNKVVARGCAVDTVDSERLAAALERSAAEHDMRIEVLLQVNTEREPQKAGIAPDELPALVDAVRGLPHLELRGLMTIPPAAADPQASRPAFARLRGLAEQHGLPELSMGMSADMDVAIEEGATMVRVGTAIFGPRATSS